MGYSAKVATATALLWLAAMSGGAAMAAATSGADPAVEEWPVWPYQAACYGPPFDPVDVFSAPADAELGSAPAEIALREALQDARFVWAGVTGHGWRRVSESETEGVFVKGMLSSPFPLWVRFERDEGWKLASSGTCTPRTILHGLQAVSWTLAPRQPALREGTRRVWVMLGSGQCASGVSQNARARKPIFRRIGKRLLMTILLEPPVFNATCIGTVEPPLLVRLPGKLGKRRLFDGGTYPPGDV